MLPCSYVMVKGFVIMVGCDDDGGGDGDDDDDDEGFWRILKETKETASSTSC